MDPPTPPDTGPPDGAPTDDKPPAFELRPEGPDTREMNTPPHGRMRSTAAASGLLTVAQIAAALKPPVADQTVRNWADREGCPVAFRDPETKVRFFDLAAVEDWRRRNKVNLDGSLSFGRGGRREGSGRKPKGHPAYRSGAQRFASPPGDDAVLALLRPEPEGPAQWTLNGAIVTGQVSLDIPQPGRATLEQISRDPTSQLTNPIAAKTFQIQANAAFQVAKTKQLTGELIDRAEAAQTWAQTLGILVRGIDNLPRRTGPAIVALVSRLCEAYAKSETDEDRAGVLERVRVGIEDELTRAGSELRRDLAGEIVAASKAG